MRVLLIWLLLALRVLPKAKRPGLTLLGHDIDRSTSKVPGRAESK